MIRIWAKVIQDGKIVNQLVFEREGIMDYSLFFDHVRDICEKLDIATPVVIKTHIFNYAKYNTVKFIKDDFTEEIKFEKLILENALI